MTAHTPEPGAQPVLDAAFLRDAARSRMPVTIFGVVFTPDPEPPAPVWKSGEAWRDAKGDDFIRDGDGWRSWHGWYSDGTDTGRAAVLPMTLLVPEGRDGEALRAHLVWLDTHPEHKAVRAHLLYVVATWLAEEARP